GENISDYLQDWVCPTGGTSDAWTSDPALTKVCRLNTLDRGVKPHGGTVCAGMYVGSLTNPKPVQTRRPYREYIQVKLNTPLQKGKIYSVELFASLVERSSLACNNIGVYFSVEKITRTELSRIDYGYLLSYEPQINSFAILTGFYQWHKISGCFRASEDFEYLTIGNFYDDAHTSFSTTPDPTGLEPYYLIDDVSVRETDALAVPLAKLGQDTTLCFNQTLRLTLPQSEQITYRWQDGTSAPSYTINQSGKYWVTATAGQAAQCSVSDTSQVKVEPPLSLPPDTILCRGESLTLSAQRPNNQFIWNTGSRDSVISVREAGIYWVQAASGSCQLSDTIRVRVADCPGLVPNVFTPNGDGRNDTFVIDNIQLLPWRMRIYNHWGTLIYVSAYYQNEWDGAGLGSGLYYYELSSHVLNRSLKGWVQLLR
ncbi:MAG: gliding motility-associated C-terminal domain-containing protein, partial [Cytophagaceae bacterium]|nr:gliding motility-associated C-terminal domain-containing protein [Cytophagaceae bacterium]